MRTTPIVSVLVALAGSTLVYFKLWHSLHFSLASLALQQSRSKVHHEEFRTVSVVYPEGEATGLAKPITEYFRGIPFAQPPVGDLRLRRPRRLAQNIGKRDATIPGPSCPQMLLSTGSFNRVVKYLGKLAVHPKFQKAVNAKEDCLTINIQRPTGTSSSSNLPVIYWIFGGAFKFGSNSIYDATKIINLSVSMGEPVMFVSANYRVGGFGFLAGKEALDQGVTNLGLLDQRLGLEWVADNIRAFGGDPGRVTLWGESSGSISVFDQMLIYDGNNTYKGKPLFHGAIMDSGSAVPSQPADSPKAQAIYDSVVTAGGCQKSDSTLDCLRSLPYEKFIDAANSVPGMLSYSSIALSYLPRPDGITLTQSPETLMRKNKYAAVPMIIGDQEDEGTIFSLLQTNLTSATAIARYLKNFFFDKADLEQMVQFVETYPEDPAAGSPFRTGNANELYPGFKRLAAILGDTVFTLPRRMVLNDAQASNPNVPAWSYLSSYGHGLPFLGTFHSSNLIQVFYGFPSNFASHAIQSYYVNFFNNRNPNVGARGYMHWPEWGDGHQMMNFFCDNASLLTDDFRQESYRFMTENTESFHF